MKISVLLFILLIVCVKAELTFTSPKKGSGSTYTLESKSTGTVITLTKGFVTSDIYSTTTVTTYYTTLKSFTQTTGVGFSENYYPGCSTIDTLTTLIGSPGCLYADKTTVYTNPKPSAAKTTISTTLDATKTLKWVFTPTAVSGTGNCLLLNLKLMPNTAITTGYENTCGANWLGFDSASKYAATFEIASPGTAVWCVQTEAQYQLVPGCGCQDGTYLDSSSVCQACQSPCANCNVAATTCTSCISGYGLSSTTCLPCGDGKYSDSNSVCQSCQSPCSKCSGTATTCTLCVSGYGLSLGTCSPCGDGKYSDSNSVCQNCQSPCTKCSGTATTCTACAPGYGLSSGTCLPCADGTYSDSNSICQNCESPCLTCSGTATTCTACRDGFYFDADSECQRCESPCSKCLGTANTCVACETGYILSGTTCIVPAVKSSAFIPILIVSVPTAIGFSALITYFIRKKIKRAANAIRKVHNVPPESVSKASPNNQIELPPLQIEEIH